MNRSDGPLRPQTNLASGTAKARDICEAVGASRLSLAEFNGDGAKLHVGALVKEMRNQSRPIKPRDLGLIGAEHLRAKFKSIGVASESFCYKRAEVEYEGVPYLAEAAFGYCPDRDDDRRIITGVNWSVAIGGDPFRRLGAFDESLGAILMKQRAGPQQPIVAFLHLACPRVNYLDRGKSSVSLPRPPGNAIIGLVEDVTKRWARQRKAEERDDNAAIRRADRLIHRDRPKSIKAAALMEQAYLAASANGTLPPNPRQIMYAARPDILAITGKDSLDTSIFAIIWIGTSHGTTAVILSNLTRGRNLASAR
jgi:DNA topoisomerase VI subunit B